MEEAGSGLGLSMSVSNSYLIGQASLTTPTVSFWHPHSSSHLSITLSLMWVLCGPSPDWGLDLCDTVCLPAPALLCFYMWLFLQRNWRGCCVVQPFIHSPIRACFLFLLWVLAWQTLATLSSRAFDCVQLMVCRAVCAKTFFNTAGYYLTSSRFTINEVFVSGAAHLNMKTMAQP